MTKEVLFSGKRVDNGEWVEGYYTELPCGSLGATIFSNDDELVCEDTTSYIIKVFTKQHTNYSNSNPLQVIECEKYEVIPETVSQFTGLTDKYKKKIFEGDIIAKGFELYEVRWNSEQVRWGIYSNNFEVAGFTKFSESYFEVVGNVYDNKELLNGKDKG